MTVKNLVGRAVALTTAACLLTALPAAARTAATQDPATQTAATRTAEPSGTVAEPTRTPAPEKSSQETAQERPAPTPEKTTEKPFTTKQQGTDEPTAKTGDGDYEEVPIDGSGQPPGEGTPPDAGDGRITARYESLPAEVRRRIGEPTAAEVVVNNELRYRDYEHARFYWTPEYGVKIVGGAILDKYLALGAHETVGVPTTDELATADGVGRYNEFVNLYFGRTNAIYWTPSTGAHEISWQVLGHWRELGAGSDLGYPTTDTTPTPDGWGLYNHFATASGAEASIYYTQPTGAHAVRGAIREKWAASGWERGPMGYPTTDERTTADGVGRFNLFTGSDGLPASILWTPSTGAHSVQGLILQRYSALGGPNGRLGYPTTDEMTTPDGRGRYNHFTGSGGASVYWAPGTGAHEVYGAIRDRWAALGWERSYLGYPISGEYTVDTGRRNDFEGGLIRWNRTTGGVVDRPW